MAPRILVAMVLTGGVALASAAVVSAAARAEPDCRCVHAGQYYQAGETACIRTPNGPRLARCGKISNLSSWRFTGEPCMPTARLEGGRHPSLTAILPPRSN